MGDLVFGTGRDDDLLVAPCGDGPVEVFGLYGDDTLESTVGEECGPVNLFGGLGSTSSASAAAVRQGPTYRITSQARIRFYFYGNRARSRHLSLMRSRLC